MRMWKNLVNRLHESQTQAKKYLIASKETNKKYYDRTAKAKEFRIGDQVKLLKGGKINRFADQYTGPFEIIQTYPNGNVKIQLTATQSKVVHSNRLEHTQMDRGVH